MTRRVLFVDDEPNVLDGLRRTLGRRFPADFAVGATEGLKYVAGDGEPYALVVSDMRMPGMSGAAFLAEVRRHSPLTTRMILSGQADVEATIQAVNEGQLFRFLTKPCSQESLIGAVNDGLAQYELVVAEKELLEKTLSGAVEVLTEILAVVNPEAYGRSTRITRFAVAIADALELRDRWQVRLAALLSQVGCVAIPEDIVSRAVAGQSLAPDEQRMFDGHGQIGAKLLAHIPRLEHVSAIIASQRAEPRADAVPLDPATAPVEALGGAVLRAAIAFDGLITAGTDRHAAAKHVAARVRELPAPAFAALLHACEASGPSVHRALPVRALEPGMTLEEDVVSTKGVRLVLKGQEITPTLLARLRSYAAGAGVVEPIRVLLTTAQATEAVPAAQGAVR
jgi:FixJ family two-component response regulator